jgi:hypothetical protein
MAKKIKFKPDTTIEAESCDITSMLYVSNDNKEDRLKDAEIYEGTIVTDDIKTYNIDTDSINGYSYNSIFDTDGTTAKNAKNATNATKATYATYLSNGTNTLSYTTLAGVKTKIENIYDASTENAKVANAIADGTRKIYIKVIAQDDYDPDNANANTLYLIT